MANLQRSDYGELSGPRIPGYQGTALGDSMRVGCALNGETSSAALPHSGGEPSTPVRQYRKRDNDGMTHKLYGHPGPSTRHFSGTKFILKIGSHVDAPDHLRNDAFVNRLFVQFHRVVGVMLSSGSLVLVYFDAVCE